MKRLILISILILLTQLSFSQNDNRIYIDENGEYISSKDAKKLFYKKWRENDFICRWDSIAPNFKRVCKLKNDQYQSGEINYDTLRSELKKISN